VVFNPLFLVPLLLNFPFWPPFWIYRK